MYHVISPDGFPITYEPFTTRRKAIAAIPVWTEQFRKRGYYLTGRQEKIPLKFLRGELIIRAFDPEKGWHVPLQP